MKKLNLSQIAGLSCMIFAIFFGAGNMVFPPAMAQQAGSNTPIALLGFVLSDVGIAIAGIMAVVIAGTSMNELASRVSKKFALLLSFAVYLCIGPLFALPRCGSVSFEIGLLPYVGRNTMLFSVLFTLLFFGLTFILSIRPGKIVDIVGKILTPILLLTILALFIAALIDPLGSVSMPRGDYLEIPLFKGIIEGYLALDGFAGLVFAILVYQALKQYQITDHKTMVKSAFLCSTLAGVLLIGVYAALALLGIQTSSMELFANGGALLSYASRTLFGDLGGLLLGAAVVLACLTTSIGLSTSFADFICSNFPKLTYRKVLAAVCLFSFIISNVGLSMLIKIVLPVLIILYPIVVVLIGVSLCDPWLKGHDSVMVMGMLFVLPFSLLDGFKNAGIIIPGLSAWAETLPLFSIGLGWLLPAAVGCIVGYFIHLPKRKINKENV